MRRLSLAFSVVLVACTPSNPPVPQDPRPGATTAAQAASRPGAPPPVTSSYGDPARDLQEAMQKAALDSVKQMTEGMLSGARPVKSTVLAGFLPTELKGYSCPKAETMDTGAGDVIASQAAVTCKSQQKDGQEMTLIVTDHVRNQMLLTPMRAIGKHRVDNDNLRLEPLSGDRRKGLVHFEKTTGLTKIELMVGERYLVSIRHVGQSSAEAKRALAAMKIDALAAFQPKPEDLLKLQPASAPAETEKKR